MKARLPATMIAQTKRITMIISEGIMGSEGNEIATLLTYNAVAEKLSSKAGIVIRHEKDVVRSDLLSLASTYQFTKTTFASPMTM